MRLSLQLNKIVRVCSLRQTKEPVGRLSRFLTSETHSADVLSDVKRINIRIRDCMRMRLVGDAQQLFDRMPHRDSVSWNSMIRGYFHNGDLSLGMRLFDQMPQRDIFSYNTVISGLMRHGETDRARQIFEEMPVRDVVTWNSMIAGSVQHSMMDEALRLFDHMPERNIISWNLVISGLVNCDSLDLAQRLFNEMPTRDIASWTIMISGVAGLGRIDESTRLFNEMPERDVRSWNAMLAAYVQNGRFKDAESLFLKMPERDLTSWKELITGLAASQRLDGAMRYFMEMPQGDPCSWNSVLLGLIRNGYVEEGHALFEKCPFKDVVSWTNMIIGYFELGDVDAACKLFRSMPYGDETSWNATIFGLGENDHGEAGLKLFTEMRVEEGINPDQATYTSVLNICSFLPSIDFGKQAHGQIIKSGFGDCLPVCNAVITMYARCGSIGSASMAFSYMPRHDTVSWNSIISGFSHHGKGKEALSFFASMRMTDAKPDQITFICVLSACSYAGLIEEGRHYYYVMVYKYLLKPTTEHYTCIVDLLGRFGFVEEAAGFIERMRGDGIEVSASVWGALLGACRIHGKAETGEIAGERILEMEPWNAGAYLILADIYMAGGKKRDAERVLVLMKERRVKKQPGCSWIDVKNSVHVFLAADASHAEISSVYNMLSILGMEMTLI